MQLRCTKHSHGSAAGASPKEELQLHVQVSDEGAAGDDLSVAVIKRQATVTHVLAVDALCSRGDTDDLGLFYISA